MQRRSFSAVGLIEIEHLTLGRIWSKVQIKLTAESKLTQRGRVGDIRPVVTGFNDETETALKCITIILHR